MKKFFSVALMMALSAVVFAQTQQPAAPDNRPAYQRFPTIPPFHILQVDSVHWYTKDDLKKNELTMIIFFSPSCEHCKHQMRDILSAYDQFKNIQIVMATYQPFEEMKEFYSYYRIADHSNIKMGRDEKYFLPPYYKMTSLPFIALYDKKGNLITTFEGNQQVATLLDAFHPKDKS